MAFEITPKIVFPGLIHLSFKTQYELTSTFLRLQEFYESPFLNIRGKFFTLEEYMDTYAERNDGKFTYYEDWSGFNVPGHIVDNFFEIFQIVNSNLQQKEINLRDVISNLKKDWDRYYIIASSEDGGKHNNQEEVMLHEIAHGMYYLFDEYRERMDKHLQGWGLGNETTGGLYRVLRSHGYTADLFKDELQAYFATSEMLWLYDFFEEMDLPWNEILQCKLVFQEYREKYLEEEKEDE